MMQLGVGKGFSAKYLTEPLPYVMEFLRQLRNVLELLGFSLQGFPYLVQAVPEGLLGSFWDLVESELGSCELPELLDL